MTRKAIIEIQKDLKACGWPVKVDGEMGVKTRQAVREFQAGLYQVKSGSRWVFSTLRATGKPGPLTRSYLRSAAKQGGKCSKNFAFAEWKSKGDGWIKVKKKHIKSMERYRKRVGGSVEIVSGYRDEKHNAAVGGASQSRHVDGDASDLNPKLTLAQVKALKVFTGIGVQRASGLVRHVDNRPGSVNSPTVWFYG